MELKKLLKTFDPDTKTDMKQKVKIVSKKKADSTMKLQTMIRIGCSQKITRNGVHLNLHGKKIWFRDNMMLCHIGQEVYLRYNLVNLENVEVYDKKTDTLLGIYRKA